MSPDLIVIRSVSLQNTVQVRFAEHDEVVESFATYRSDEPLNVAVLPRRAWRRGVIADSHCPNAAGVCWAEGAVAVANRVTRCFVPGKGVSHLTCDPLRGRIVRHADARDRGRPINRGEVHDQAAGTTLSGLEDLPAQSRRRDRIHRSVRGSKFSVE